MGKLLCVIEPEKVGIPPLTILQGQISQYILTAKYPSIERANIIKISHSGVESNLYTFDYVSHIGAWHPHNLYKNIIV